MEIVDWLLQGRQASSNDTVWDDKHLRNAALPINQCSTADQSSLCSTEHDKNRITWWVAPSSLSILVHMTGYLNYFLRVMMRRLSYRQLGPHSLHNGQDHHGSHSMRDKCSSNQDQYTEDEHDHPNIIAVHSYGHFMCYCFQQTCSWRRACHTTVEVMIEATGIWTTTPDVGTWEHALEPTSRSVCQRRITELYKRCPELCIWLTTLTFKIQILRKESAGYWTMFDRTWNIASVNACDELFNFFQHRQRW